MRRLIASASLLVSLAVLAASATAQTIDAVSPTDGAIGDVLTLTGSDLDVGKLKPVFLLDGEPVKKTKLRVVKGSQQAGSVQVEVKAAVPGTFRIAFKQGKDFVGTSDDTFTARGPEPQSVEPGVANPGDSVVIDVAFRGFKRFEARIGGAKAKLLDATDPDGDGISTMTVRVPKLPAGTWPVSVRTPLGEGLLKDGLSILDGQGEVPVKKVNTTIELTGLKPYKPKIVQIDEDPTSFDIGLLAGGKKRPRAIAVTLPVLVEDVAEGDSFNSAPAQIVYTETKKGATTAWFSQESGGWSIDVVSVTENEIIVSICGELTRVSGDAGPETTVIGGMVVSPKEEPPLPEGPCEAQGSIQTSITGNFEYSDSGSAAWVPGINKTFCGVGNWAPSDPGGALVDSIVFSSTYDPNTQGEAVLNGFFGPNTLEGFVLSVSGSNQWASSVDPITLLPTVTVTITSNETLSQSSGSIFGSLTGTIEGTVFFGADSQTISGSFCLPWGLGDGS